MNFGFLHWSSFGIIVYVRFNCVDDTHTTIFFPHLNVSYYLFYCFSLRLRDSFFVCVLHCISDRLFCKLSDIWQLCNNFNACFSVCVGHKLLIQLHNIFYGVTSFNPDQGCLTRLF